MNPTMAVVAIVSPKLVAAKYVKITEARSVISETEGSLSILPLMPIYVS